MQWSFNWKLFLLMTSFFLAGEACTEFTTASLIFFAVLGGQSVLLISDRLAPARARVASDALRHAGSSAPD